MHLARVERKWWQHPGTVSDCNLHSDKHQQCVDSDRATATKKSEGKRRGCTAATDVVSNRFSY